MVRANPDMNILGGWEENEEARQAAQAWGVEFAYRRLEDLLRDLRQTKGVIKAEILAG